MSSDSILIISNYRTISSHLINKIKLLRDKDTIKCVTFLESISVLNSSKPSLIMIYCSQADSVDIVKEIRAIKRLKKVPIIFVMDSISEDKLFSVFDYGIDEFFCLHDPNSIILMRTILALQKSALYRRIEITEAILSEEKILDSKTNVYMQPYANSVLKNIFKICLENNAENTMFMYLKAVQKDDNYTNIQQIAKTIRTMLRENDVVTFGGNSGFYIILSETDEIGAQAVFNKLKEKLKNECEIYANSTKIIHSFKETEKVLIKQLNEQIIKKEEYKNIPNIKQETNEQTNKKTIVNIYNELEKMIIPVFYHFQTVYTNTFVDVDINYDILPEKSSFILKTKSITSSLNISINEDKQVVIELIHLRRDEPGKGSKLTYNFEEFSEATLSLALKDFVNEFSEFNSYNKLN